MLIKTFAELAQAIKTTFSGYLLDLAMRSLLDQPAKPTNSVMLNIFFARTPRAFKQCRIKFREICFEMLCNPIGVECWIRTVGCHQLRSSSDEFGVVGHNNFQKMYFFSLQTHGTSDHLDSCHRRPPASLDHGFRLDDFFCRSEDCSTRWHSAESWADHHAAAQQTAPVWLC